MHESFTTVTIVTHNMIRYYSESINVGHEITKSKHSPRLTTFVKHKFNNNGK